MTSYLLAGPAIEPVTLGEAKAYCRIDGDAEDGLVGTLIAAARLHVEGHTGRALIAQTWRLVLDRWPAGGWVPLPVAPAASLVAVTATDADWTPHELELEQFALDGPAGRLLLPQSVAGMPVLRRQQGIAIDYVAGYGEAAEDVPADLRQAVLVLVAYWFENRDAALDSGAGTPAAFARLLATYRRVRM